MKVYNTASGGGPSSSVEITRIVTPSSPQDSVIALSGRPKLIIFTASSILQDQRDIEGYDAIHGWGACSFDGGISQWAACRISIDSVTPSQVNGQFSSNYCIRQHASSSTMAIEGRVTAVSDTGFTMTWDTVPAASQGVHLIVFYDSDKFPKFKVGTFNNLASTGNQSITGVGFSPDGIIFGSEYANGTSHDDTGVALADGTQWAVSNFEANGANPTSAKSIFSTALCILRWGNGASQYEASYVSSDSDGFTINSSVNDANIRPYGYIAFKNVSLYTDFFDVPASSSWPLDFTLSSNGQTRLVFFVTQDNGSLVDMTQEQDAARGYGFTTGPNTNGIVNPNNCIGSWYHSAGGVVLTEASRAGDPFETIRIFTTNQILINEIDAETKSLDVGSFTMTYQGLTGVSHRLFYLAFDTGNATATGTPNKLFLNDEMEIAAGDTHYLTIPHTTAGITYANWTIQLFKAGQRVTDTPVDMVENPSGTYTFSFTNDKEDEVQWTLLVWQTSATTIKYGQTWKVKKKIIEQNVKQLRSRQDSDGGFFKSSYDQET